MVTKIKTFSTSLHPLNLARLVIFLIAFLTSCTAFQDNAIDPPTLRPGYETAQSPNPQLLATADVMILDWTYIPPLPQAENNRVINSIWGTGLLELERGGISFFTRDGGFDLIYGGFNCSTEPTVTIRTGQIDIYPNDSIWDDCEAIKALHIIRVESDITDLTGSWMFELHDGGEAPPKADNGLFMIEQGHFNPSSMPTEEAELFQQSLRSIGDRSACSGGIQVFTPDELECSLASHVNAFGDSYVEYLAHEIAVMLMPSDSMPLWIGGAIVYHVPTLSSLVFDRCGLYDRSFDQFQTDESEKILLNLIEDREFTSRIQQRVRTEWPDVTCH